MKRVPIMVLSAGLGTRLSPLTDELPKPLVPVGDQPALAHVLDAVSAAASAIVVNAHHRIADMRAFAAQNPRAFVVSEERDLLGTAGGVRHAEAALGEGDVLVWNGDILLLGAPKLDLRALVGSHASDATLVVRPGEVGAGNVGIDREGRVVRLRKESTGHADAEVRGGHFLGIHVLGARLRASLPSIGCLVGDVYLPALRAGATLRAFCTDAAWHDIGSVATYLEANAAWLAAQGTPTWCAPDARVAANVTLAASIVGAGASVTGEGRLERCVVWPGASARAPLADAVVTPRGIARAATLPAST